MASFEKIGSGVRAVISRGTGKHRIKKTKVWPTMKQAKRWATEIEHAYEQQQREGVSGDFTFAELFDEYAEKVSPKKKGAHWEQLRLALFKRFPLSDVLLKDATLVDIEQFISMRLKTVKSSTVNRELNLIRHCITKAHHWCWLPRTQNPMDDLERPEDPPPRERLVAPDEIEVMCHVLDYKDDEPVHTICHEVAVAWLFAIESAMRAGEITDICTSCCSLDNAVVKIEQTKNGSKRDVPVTSRGIKLLEKLYEKPEHAVCPYSLPVDERPKRYQPKPGQAPIYHHGECKRLFHVSAGSLSSMFRKYRLRTPIQDLTFHDSRHEAITRLAKSHSPFDLARIVGHKDIKQLMTYYNKSAIDIAKAMREDESASAQLASDNKSMEAFTIDKDQLPHLITSLLTALQNSNDKAIEINL